MDVSNTQCKMIVPLIVKWHTGAMRDVDRDGYEQHLLVCPPCLVQSDKAALALGALRAARKPQPEPDFMSQLLQLQQTDLGRV